MNWKADCGVVLDGWYAIIPQIVQWENCPSVAAQYLSTKSLYTSRVNEAEGNNICLVENKFTTVTKVSMDVGAYVRQ